MRALIPAGSLLGLLIAVALATGDGVSAKPPDPRQVGYGTPTPTTTPAGTATPGGGGGGGGPGGSPKPTVRLALLGGGSIGTGLQARVGLSTAGKVRLQASAGKRKVGGTSARFARGGTKVKRIRFKNLDAEAPVKIVVRARGRSREGVKAKTVKRSRSLKA